MNIAITPTAESLIQQLVESGYADPADIVEQALQYFYSQQSIDISLGFSELNEAELIEDNNHRWQCFQENSIGQTQAEIEAHFIQ